MPENSRVTVEIGTDKDGTPSSVELFVNAEGIKRLIEELSALSEKNDHFHWFAPVWAPPDGELSQVAYHPEKPTASHLKVNFRPDSWDRKYYPHLFSKDDQQ